jgi:hypothetical protein
VQRFFSVTKTYFRIPARIKPAAISSLGGQYYHHIGRHCRDTNLLLSSYLNEPLIALKASGTVSKPSKAKAGISWVMTVPIIQRYMMIFNAE